MFPAPPRPTFAPAQASTTTGFFRYEDVTQDGRLISLAIPPALGGLWRDAVKRHPGARNSQATGVIPLLTRLTIGSLEQHIRVDREYEARAGFELAHDGGDDSNRRLFMNVWCEVHGAAGRIVPREPAGPLALAGTLFAEHTFTRPFAAPDKRRVTRLEADGYPTIPDAHYAYPAPTTAMDAPAGATWLDDLAPDAADLTFTLDQTDSNQHVNSLVYVRIFLDAAQRRLAAAGKGLRQRSRAVDIAYRKPCFAGDRVRCHLRLFALGDAFGVAGFVASPGEEAKPRCYVRVLYGA